MGYVANYHIDVLKGNERIFYDDLPETILQETLNLGVGAQTFEEFYAIVQDYHESDLEEQLIELSLKYPAYTFLLREFPVEHDSVTFDFFRNGKRATKEMEIKTPTVSDEDFE